MKIKFLLPLLICLTILNIANAQISKGKYLLGGNLSFYDGKNANIYMDRKYKSTNATIQLGKAIENNTVVGFIGSYAFSNNSYPESINNSAKTNTYTAGLFYRRYKKLSDKFNLFGEANARYFYSKDIQHNNLFFSKLISKGGIAAFAPGLSYAISKKIQFELSMPDIISFSYSHNDLLQQPDPALPSISKKGKVFTAGTNLNGNLLYL